MLGFNEIGDRNAPEGSRSYAVWHSYHIVTSWQKLGNPIANVRDNINNFRRNEYFKLLEDRHGNYYQTWQAWASESPPWGLGLDPEFVETLLNEKDFRKLSLQVAAYSQEYQGDTGKSPAVVNREAAVAVPAAEKHGTNQHTGGRKTGRDNVTSSRNRGNSASSIAARIKRDHPELARRMENGEISPYKAGILAGIKDPMVQVKTNDVDAAARVLAKHFGDRLGELIAALQRESRAAGWPDTAAIVYSVSL